MDISACSVCPFNSVPSTPGFATEYGDSASNVVSLDDARVKRQSRQYDKAGRVLDTGRFRYHYDMCGRVVEKTEYKDGFRPKTTRFLNSKWTSSYCISNMGEIMKKFDFKTRNEIAILTGFLSALDEEVISDSGYTFIEGKNINNESDLRSISDVILKPWFLEYKPDNRNKVIHSIDFIVNGGEELINIVLGDVRFAFNGEIEDKQHFLRKVKRVLEEYVIENNKDRHH
ncbi:hypothetical protein ABXV22_08250 [Vibrio rotiferianus]|uniref:hypothetical protein n=1 Tax=Vibrio rotiferianus TaxID=190895 RepID=UPI0033924F23